MPRFLEWWNNTSDADSDRILWGAILSRYLEPIACILLSCGFVLVMGVIVFIVVETTPNSSVKAGNLTMSIDEFASKDDLWKDLISGPVDPDLEIKMAEIQNWISKSSQKFDANSYFSKATSYVATHRLSA